MKKTKKLISNGRKTHQFDLYDTELQDIFNFGGDPERIGSKGRALRAVIERHKEQIHTINALHSQLKQLLAKEAATS